MVQNITFQGGVFGNLNNTNLNQSSIAEYFTGQNSKDDVVSKDGQSFRFNSELNIILTPLNPIYLYSKVTYGYNDSKYLNTSEVFNADYL